MQRLVAGANVSGIEARRHRFDAFAFAGQQQAGGVEAQGFVPVGMAEHASQKVHIVLKPLLTGSRGGRNCKGQPF
jgi:hypothetical protein